MKNVQIIAEVLKFKVLNIKCEIVEGLLYKKWKCAIQKYNCFRDNNQRIVKEIE